MLRGLIVNPARLGVGASVSAAEYVAPEKEARIVTALVVVTGNVVTLNVPIVCPAAMATDEGTVARPGAELESPMDAPPAGAGAASVTVPTEGLPPVTLVGFIVSVSAAAATVIVPESVDV